MDTQQSSQPIDIIMRHTKYTEEEANQKLLEHNNNYMDVIRAYLTKDSITSSTPSTPSTPSTYSTNQQRFKEMRNMLGYVPVKLLDK